MSQSTRSKALVYLEGDFARKIYRKLPPTSKKAIRKLVGRAASAAPPVLSIIIPVYNVESYVAETLESLQRQTLVKWEAIVVNDGSVDGSGDIVDGFAKGDRRIKVIHQENAGLGAARNSGIKAARGKFLTFLDSDDIIPRDAYKAMVERLAKSGSDFAVGAVHRTRAGKITIPAWTKAVHSHMRTAITIDEFPDAMMDVLACNRVFLTSFWRESIGEFPVGVAYEDHKVMVASYVRARKFDILTEVTYLWRIREDEGSISQQKHDLQNLIDRIGVKNDAFEVVSNEASSLVRDSWLSRVIDQDIPLYGDHALRADQEYRDAVQGFASRYVSMANQRIWEGVRWNQRFKSSLMASGSWEALAQFNLDFRNIGGVPNTKIQGANAVLDLEAFPQLDHQLDLDALTLNRRLTPLRGYVERAYWDDENWNLCGFAFVSYVSPDREWKRKFYLQNLRTLEKRDLGSGVSERNYFANRFARHGNFDYSMEGFRLSVGKAQFQDIVDSASSSIKDEWQLRVSLSAGELNRDEPMEFSQKSGSAGWLRAGVLPTTRSKVIARMDPENGLVLGFRNDPVWLEQIALTSDGVEGEISVSSTYRKTISAVVIQRGTNVRGETPVEHDVERGVYRFKALLPSDGPIAGALRLRVRHHDDSVRIISWPEFQESPVTKSTGTLMRSTHGYVDYFPEDCVPFVTKVSVDNTKIAVTVTAPGFNVAELHEAKLAHSKHEIRVSSVKLVEGMKAELVFDLISARGVTRGPAGIYRMSIGGQNARPSEALGDVLPQFFTDDNYRYEIKHAGANVRREFLLSISSPLKESELGTFAQIRFRREYQRGAQKPIHGVLFQCYRGETASDNQRAIHDELVRRDAKLELYWGVSSSNVVVPAGGIPVIIGSREWYRILGAVTYLCNNIDFDKFFVKQPHQRFLQTFHGHAFKAMGLEFWKNKGFNDWEIAAEIERRNEAWDSAVMPNHESVTYYDAQYSFEGEYLISGYPRNDAIVNGNRSEALERVRSLYGIDEEKELILYAPTWRDASATGAWSASMFAELDIPRLAEALGRKYVLLIRGHNYNLREQSRVSRSASVIDVTEYPEINDLILAADVALLDYSSLRFDWAITQKPMLFFVPDKDEYLSVRPGLFSYDESAPGPQLYTTEAVIEAMGNINSYGTEHGSELDEFNRRFNGLSDGRASERVVDAFFGSEVTAVR